jgi:hypothetical protein
MVLGPLLVLAYNLELFGGFVHTDVGFALAWGSFPVLVAYVAQARSLAAAPLIAAVSACALSMAQRQLSTPARFIRRRLTTVEGRGTLREGGAISINQQMLLAPLEGALQAMSWAVVLLASGLAVARLT